MSDPPPDNAWAFNGINGDTGGYATTATAHDIVQVARGEAALDITDERDLRERVRQAEKHHGIAVQDPSNLAQTGWGIIFPATRDPHEQQQIAAIKAALQPLLDHRRTQATAGGNERYYSAGHDALSYRPNDTNDTFMQRYDAVPGPADPDHGLPYYLLIVGSPEQIPYDFQYQLDVQYAVGRLWFDDDTEAYRHYAEAVLAAEQHPNPQRRATFFGTRNQDDQATNLSASRLVEPLHTTTAAKQPAGWSSDLLLAEHAHKKHLQEVLGGTATPDLLFTATHGMEFSLSNPQRQEEDQGALLCQDWPGPRAWAAKPIPHDHYFAARDLAASKARLDGLIAFFFACYGAGTPRTDDFARNQGKPTIAERAFVAHLPRQMLRQGALAVISHVGRAWGTSYMWQQSGGSLWKPAQSAAQIKVFTTLVAFLMRGQRVGSALEWFNTRYAELAAYLNHHLDWQEHRKIDEVELAMLWMATSDARNYIILGDPAVHFNLGTPAAPPLPDYRPETALPRFDENLRQHRLEKQQAQPAPTATTEPPPAYTATTAPPLLTIWVAGAAKGATLAHTHSYRLGFGVAAPADAAHQQTVDMSAMLQHLPDEQQIAELLLILKGDNITIRGDTVLKLLVTRTGELLNQATLTLQPGQPGPASIRLLLVDPQLQTTSRELLLTIV